MTDIRKIEHNNTDEIVCPFCGHIYNNSITAGEFLSLIRTDEELFNCENCHKNFYVLRIVKYTTAEVEQKTDSSEKTEPEIFEEYLEQRREEFIREYQRKMVNGKYE